MPRALTRAKVVEELRRRRVADDFRRATRAPHGEHRPTPAAPAAAATVTADRDAHVSVVIASYNRRERLRQVLDGLKRQQYPTDRFEVIVVLDGSTDGSAEMVRSLEKPFALELVEHGNRGVAASRNSGLSAAAGPLVVFLDDDVVPEPGLVGAHAQHHTAAPDSHVAVGPYPPARAADDDPFAVLAGQWWSDHFRRKAEPDHQWTFVDFGNGNLSAPRALLMGAGGWDEAFAVRHEDWEFGIRLLERGVRLAYCAEAVGRHHFDPAFRTALRNRRLEGSSDVVLARMHPHARGRLGFAELATRTGELPMRRRLMLGHPRLSGLFARPGAGVARALEAAGGGELWRRLASRLLSHAYALGVADEIRSQDEVRWLLGWADSDGVRSLDVRLGEPGLLRIPDPVRQVELLVGYEGGPQVSVMAMAPEAQWDWEALTERVADAAWELAPDPIAAQPR